MRDSGPSRITTIIVPATVLLSFISFWRAAAVVLADLGSSAYYVGGIAERAIGKSAPWFILAVMLLSYAVRAVYIESCSMFVRGGVYRVVRYAMGSTAAKFSVSALLFDYVLTGPISAVSAGLYLAGLINETGQHFRIPWLRLPSHPSAAGFAILVTLYFWHSNRRGIPFSSGKALRIMQITSAMVVVLIGWCLFTIFSKGAQPIPPPTMGHFNLSSDAVGWLKGTTIPQITVVAVLIGLGHSLLAMSGEESLAQVYREIAAPKLRNLLRAGFVIFIFSLLFTSLVSFFAVMIIPDSERSKYFENLISGISMFLAGRSVLKLVFHAVVVLVGVLILSGAVNTAFVGSNGVLNRVADDGVLPGWFREPHPKHGTTHRLLNLIVVLQLVTIAISRGDVYVLGEAYAFGVAWSFAMNALAMLVLRFKEPKTQRWKVPINLRVGRKEIPVGLVLITLMLFSLCGINLLTKKAATLSGLSFTLVFFIAFSIFERRYRPKDWRNPKPGEEPESERFRFEARSDLSPQSLRVRALNVLVAVNDPNKLDHLYQVLEETDPGQMDTVVMSVNEDADSEQDGADAASVVVDKRETSILSQVVHAAEKMGKPVRPIVIPGKDAYGLIIQAARQLHSSRVVLRASPAAGEQRRNIFEAWKRQQSPKVRVDIVSSHSRESLYLE